MLSDNAVEELKSKNPNKELSLVVVDLDGAELEFVCANPSKAQVAKYLQELGEDGQAFKAAEHFVLSCVVHPERKEVVGVFDKHPLIISTLNKELEKRAGFGAKAQVKKL